MPANIRCQTSSFRSNSCHVKPPLRSQYECERTGYKVPEIPFLNSMHLLSHTVRSIPFQFPFLAVGLSNSQAYTVLCHVITCECALTCWRCWLIFCACLLSTGTNPFFFLTIGTIVCINSEYEEQSCMLKFFSSIFSHSTIGLTSWPYLLSALVMFKAHFHI